MHNLLNLESEESGKVQVKEADLPLPFRCGLAHRSRGDSSANLRAQHDDLWQLQHGSADSVEHVLQLIYYRYQGFHCEASGWTMRGLERRRVDEENRSGRRSVSYEAGFSSSNARASRVSSSRLAVSRSFWPQLLFTCVAAP